MNPKTRTRAPATAATSSSAETRLGCLVEGSTPGALVVQYAGSDPLSARTTVPLDQPAIVRAIATRQPALLLFEGGDLTRPIIVGLLQPDPGAAMLSALLAPKGVSPAPVEARLDGKRVILEGKDEVTLKCGDASITLRRDGKVILRGAYIETTATGVNRIRGGSVKIN